MTEPSDAGSGSPSTTTAGAENVAAQKTEPAGGEQDPDGEALDRKLMDLTEEGDDDEQEKIDLDEEMVRNACPVLKPTSGDLFLAISTARLVDESMSRC